MIVRRTIDKDELKELPKVVFPGRIHVIQSESETEKAVAYLQSRPVIGIDSETRPSFTKGQSHKVALLQISSEECCFSIPAQYDDFMMLHKRAPFNQQKLYRITGLCTSIRNTGQKPPKDLRHLIKEKISKSQRLSNWEADVLSDGQKQYAATDAWACLNIYNRLQELKRTGDFE